MAFTLINHLDNYARPLKCLNDQGRYDCNTEYWIYPLKMSKCLGFSCVDQGVGRKAFSMDDMNGEKAHVVGASIGVIPRVMAIGII